MFFDHSTNSVLSVRSGECAAPKLWEETIAPFLEEPNSGFQRGANDKCVFYHKERDILLTLWVDDCLIDADEDGIQYVHELLASKFALRDLQILSEENPIDFIGMDVLQDKNYTYLSMKRYIQKCVISIEQTLRELASDETQLITGVNSRCELKRADRPISKDIDLDGTSRELTPEEVALFMTCVGMGGWLSNTARPDVSYAQSRISQHMKKPTLAALEAVLQMFSYHKHHDYLCLAAHRWKQQVFGPQVKSRSSLTFSRTTPTATWLATLRSTTNVDRKTGSYPVPMAHLFCGIPKLPLLLLPASLCVKPMQQHQAQKLRFMLHPML